MSISRTILFKSLVKQYYRQNAGLFAFLLFMLLGAVGRANEAGLLEYHYSLIQGMMLNPAIFMLVLLAWFFYAKKCEQFITPTLRRPDFSFLNILSLVNTKRAYRLLMEVQLLVFLPVILYMLVVAVVGFYKQWYVQTIVMLLYVLVICFVSARWYLYMLQNPGADRYRLKWRIPDLFWETFYWSILIRYVLTNRKLLLFIIKIYSCGMLCLLVVRQTPAVYDLSIIILFYSFGLLGHGVLIRQVRAIEDRNLVFYRSLPRSLFGRYVQYVCLYFILFIPEIITIGYLTAAYLHYQDALLFIFFGYSVLLLLNSLLFIKSFTMFGYLKIITGFFFVIFLAMVSGMLQWLTVFSFILAIVLFFSRYYRYEPLAASM